MTTTPVLVILKGLPASGKTTWSKQQKDPNTMRVNKDDLREMLHAGVWSPKNEKVVLAMRDAMIAGGLERGLRVICDDTNLHPKHERRLREIAARFGAEVEVMVFDADVDVCLSRNALRVRPVPSHVIISMAKQFGVPTVTPHPRRLDLNDSDMIVVVEDVEMSS